MCLFVFTCCSGTHQIAASLSEHFLVTFTSWDQCVAASEREDSFLFCCSNNALYHMLLTQLLHDHYCRCHLRNSSKNRGYYSNSCEIVFTCWRATLFQITCFWGLIDMSGVKKTLTPDTDINLVLVVFRYRLETIFNDCQSLNGLQTCALFAKSVFKMNHVKTILHQLIFSSA